MKLKNVSHRHNRAMRNAVATPERKPFFITDPSHQPDLKGEFGGVKVNRIDGKQVVHLTEKTARFYLDSGAVAPHEDAPQQRRPTGVPAKA